MTLIAPPARLVVPAALRARIDSEHANRITAELAPLRHGADIPPPGQHLLFLCFTNRCGSNYLASLLASTGVFNEAGEFFNADTVLEHASQYPSPSLRAYMAHLPNLVGAGAWLAAKASVDQLMMLTDASILDETRARSHFILLERRDRLGQAISRCIAAQNGSWTSRHPSRLPDHLLTYRRPAIDAELARIELANAGFYSFFAGNALVPVHLAYEDVVADPVAAVARIGAWLGVPDLLADPARVAILPQANAVNADWRARYLAGL